MFNKFKNFWTLKRTVVAIVCFVFALALTGTLVWQLNKNSKGAIFPETQIEREEDVEYVVGPVMSTKHEREQQNENSFNPQLADDEYVAGQAGGAYTADELPSSIKGGTTFQLVNGATGHNGCADNCYTLKFTGGTVADVRIHIKKGYEFSGLYAGDSGLTASNYNNGAYAHWYYISDTNNNIGAESNSEACDPNYTGKIHFVIVCKVQKFNLQTYHITQNSLTYDVQQYKISASTALVTACVDNVHEKPIGQGFDYWMLNPNYKGLTVSSVYDTNKIKVTSTDIEVVFSLRDADSSTAGLNPLANGWYIVTHVQGYGEISQNENNILILAKWKRTYEVEVDNSNATYWQNTAFNLGDDAQKLYGATVNEDENKDSDFNKVSFDINRDVTYKYYFTDSQKYNDVYGSSLSFGHAFYSISNDTTVANVFDEVKYSESPYVAYNYGHEITHYEVQVVINGNDEQDCCYNAGYSFSELANGADVWYNHAYYVKFVIRPVWAKATVEAYDIENNALETFDFGEDYEIPSDEYLVGGKTLVGFNVVGAQEECLIAKSADVWNYTGFGDKYTYSPATYNYEIVLEPCYVNDVIKVELDDVVTYDTNQYKLANNSGYEFSTETNEKADAYHIALAEYDGQPLVDNYVNGLKTQINSWKASLNYGTHPFMGKVFADGTVEAGVLSTASELFIYLAHQTELVKPLPSFVSTDRQLILWKTENNIVFNAEQYEDRFEEEKNTEKTGYTEHTSWGVGDGTTLTPIYAYQLELYYEDANTAETGVYTYIKSGYYGAYTTLTLPTLSATTADDKAFAGWIVDLNALKYYSDCSHNITDLHDSATPISISGISHEFDAIFSNCGSNRFNDGENVWIYNTDSVKGSGIFEQDSTRPIVRAKYSTTYQATIDNSGKYNDVYWTGNNLEGGLDDYGVGVGNSEINNNNFTGTITIANTTTNMYAYPFMSSQSTDGTSGLAFYKKENWAENQSYASFADDKYYYVYNYGHFIKTWEIGFVVEQGSESNLSYYNYFLTYNTGTWAVSNSNNGFGTQIDEIINKNMEDVAEAADEFLQITYGRMSVMLIPHWEKANIQVKSSQPIGITKFSNEYNLATLTKNDGQTLFAYAHENEKMVAISGVWNYKEISFDKYNYNPSSVDALNEYCLGSGTYTINVEPVWVDDIFKVNLVNVPSVINEQSNKYILNNLGKTDFIFELDSNKYSNNSYNFLEYAGIFNDYIYLDYENYAEEKTLVENYVLNGLSNYLNNWNQKISNSTLQILKKVNYNNGSLEQSNILNVGSQIADMWIYLANNQQYKNLPVFEHEYQKLIFWKNSNSDVYYTTKEYNENLYGAELNGLTSSNKFWSLNDGHAEKVVTIQANYVYNVKMYYEDIEPNYEGIIYKYDQTVDAKWYGKNTVLPLVDGNGEYLNEFKPDVNDKPTYASKFKNWVLNLGVAQNYYAFNYNIDVLQGGNTTITLTKNDVKLVLTVKGQNQFDSNLYYISAVQGFGVIVQSAFNPFLTAQWAKFYDAVIDNSYNSLWEANENNLFGAYSKTILQTSEQGGLTTGFEITDDNDYKYPFMSSETNDGTGLSFYHKTNWNDSEYVARSNKGYYYVYNYGHYINGWNIKSGVWFKYDGSEWKTQTQNTNKSSAINVLTTQTMQDLASIADEYFAYATGRMTLTISPEWKETTINVKLKEAGDSLDTFKFATENYNLPYSRLSDKPVGQSLFAYSYDGGTSLIATSGVWNYKNIDESYYLPYENSTGVIGKGVYAIEVSPIWIDDIYKVNLTNAKISTVNTFVLSNCDYQFNQNAGAYDTLNDITQITFNNSILNGYSFRTYSGGFIDNYIVDLKNYRERFIEGINGDGTNDFDIFKKVYHSVAGTVINGTDDNSQPISSLKVGSEDDVINAKFHIYLANSQQTGMLPVFEKNFYTLIYWKNVYHKDKSECLGESCAQQTKHFIYTTKAYDKDEHEAEIKDGALWKFECHTHDFGFDYIWKLSDGYKLIGTEYDVVLDAYYFRKNYDLNIETYFDEQIDRRGYVVIDVYDRLAIDPTLDDMGGRYLIICENGSEMAVYKVLNESTSLQTTSLDETRLSKVIDAEGTITARKVSWPIKLYAGCDITMKVYDQSQDANAMATGFFDEMIGYKFKKQISGEVVEKGEVVNKPNLFGNADAGNAFVYTVKADEIDNEDKNKGKGYITGAQIKVGVHFEKIIYNLNFEIDSVYAGEFNVQANSAFSGAKTAYTLENMSVENFYEVDYYSYAGFKLQQNAFVLNNGIATKTLKTYDDNAVATDAQIYRLTTPNVARNLYGTWLREFFYCSHTSYDIDLTELGSLLIQTDVIEFVYGVKVYDETDASKVNENYIIETPNKFTTSLALNKETGLVLTPKVSTYLTTDDYDFWYYISDENSVNYALLSTRMFIPRNYTTEDNNHHTKYDFLLANEPTNTFALNSSMLTQMVESYQDGKIIKKDNRNIFIMLEVRRLLEVTMSVEKLYKDTNSTTRTTILTNTTKNSRAIVVAPNADSKVGQVSLINPKSTGLYYVDGTETSLVAYSYVGLENKLSSVYDGARYSSVDYYLNGSVERMAGNTFTLSENGSVVICYIPKGLNVEISYTLDGNQIADDDVATYLNDNNIYKPNDYSIYYMGDKVTYMVECVNQDYHLKVSINGLDKGTTTNTNRTVYVAQYESIENAQPVTIDNRYVISDIDYEFEKIKIEVQVFLKNNSKITIQYQLIEPTKKLIDDDYGTFDVFIFNDKEKENVLSTELIVIEGRDVYVELDLNLGYSFTGKIKHSTDSSENVEIVDGKIKLISGFAPEVHYGDYYILIDKRPVSAILNTTGLKAQYAINGKTNLVGLYVGQTIELTSIDVNEERLGCFYYLDSSGNKIYLTDNKEIDGKPLKSLKITSDLLNEVGSFMINFGVIAIERYKLDLQVVGQEFLIKDGLKVSYISNSENYELGTYVDEGTEVTLTAESLRTGKYDIELKGGEFKFNDESKTQISVDVISVGEIDVEMNANRALVLTISPKLYQVNVSENVYSTLSAVLNNTPDSTVDAQNQVNNLKADGQNYNNVAILEFARKTNDRELASIYITGNDSDDEIVIEFNGDIYVTYKLTIEEDGSTTKTVVELNDYGFKLELISDINGKLTYTTQNNINIRFDYKMYKVIRA